MRKILLCVFFALVGCNEIESFDPENSETKSCLQMELPGSYQVITLTTFSPGGEIDDVVNFPQGYMFEIGDSTFNGAKYVLDSNALIVDTVNNLIIRIDNYDIITGEMVCTMGNDSIRSRMIYHLKKVR